MKDEMQPTPRRLKTLIITLLFLVAFSFYGIGFMIGRTSDTGRYAGQIIDTIVIGAGQGSSPSVPEGERRIDVRGRVVYTDGTPYRHGLVEIRSEPRYTTTDDDGRFVFIDVVPGAHRIRVFRDEAVVAEAEVTIAVEAVLETSQIVKLSEGVYCILTPIDLPQIDLVLHIVEKGGNGNQGSGGVLEIILGAGSGGGSTPSEGETPGERDPSGPSESEKPDDGGGTPEPDEGKKPTEEEPPGSTDESDPGEMPGEGEGPFHPSGEDESGPSGEDESGPSGEAPRLTVSGDEIVTDVWTRFTAIDLFAERAGNYGVRTIEGQNVIAPGSYGNYAFRIQNSESRPLQYTISLYEADENSPRLPMSYRLKTGVGGSAYVDGSSWKKAELISSGLTAIAPGAVSYYTLEWKWDSSSDSSDTAIGTQGATPLYILNIVVAAQFE